MIANKVAGRDAVVSLLCRRVSCSLGGGKADVLEVLQLRQPDSKKGSSLSNVHLVALYVAAARSYIIP